MRRDEFWSLIDATRADNPDEHAEAIQIALSKRTAEKIVDFERHMADLQALSYSWKLWGAAYLINGGCSDDGFDYFCGWLILQGQSVFDDALSEPDSLAEVPQLEDGIECEKMLCVAQSAYESVTGNKIPSIPINIPELGETWDFDDDAQMKQRYPKLFAKFYEG
jgi:hypothetical protein